MNMNIKIILSTISPRLTTHLMYLYNFKKKLNLKQPKDINEKLQYLKLKTYFENPTVTKCVDKWLVRLWLKEKGYDYLLPNLIGGGYNDANEVKKSWEGYPDKFVIKCNHGCGYNILITDKELIDIDETVEQLEQWMKVDYWKVYCEPQYKDVPKRIIVEEYLGDDIQTYKFYCFNGKPEIVYVSSNGENGEKDLYLDYFDINWNRLPITLVGHLHARRTIEKPKNLNKMVELSCALSEDFPFVRVDLYNIDGNIFFSELTFIPTGGAMKLEPKRFIEEWGNLLQIQN